MKKKAPSFGVADPSPPPSSSRAFIEAFCWCLNTTPALGMHCLDALLHCPQFGLNFSSHFSLRALHVWLTRHVSRLTLVKGKIYSNTNQPVRDRISLSRSPLLKKI